MNSERITFILNEGTDPKSDHECRWRFGKHSQTENLKETPTDVEQGHPVFSERWVSLFNIGP